MAAANGFDYAVHGADVVITHRGKVAATLRGERAVDFLQDVDMGNPQELMARLTGNYRQGNERQARHHPRNRGR